MWTGREKYMSLNKAINGYAKVACMIGVLTLIITILTEGKNFAIPKFAFVEAPLLWFAIIAIVIPLAIAGYFYNPEKEPSPP